MPDIEYEHSYSFVVNMADQAIVAHAITPKTLPFITKWLAPLAVGVPPMTTDRAEIVGSISGRCDRVL